MQGFSGIVVSHRNFVLNRKYADTKSCPRVAAKRYQR